MITDEPWSWHPLYKTIEVWSPWSGADKAAQQIGWIWTQGYSASELNGVLQFCSATQNLAEPLSLGADESPTWYVIWRLWPASGGVPIPGQRWELQGWLHAPPSVAVAVGGAIRRCSTNYAARDMMVTDRQNRMVG